MEPAFTGIRFTNQLASSLAIQNQNLLNGSGVAAGDFDGDGHCDLYFCAIAGANALFKNLGDWRFTNVSARAGVECAGWPSTGAVFADTDGDGDLDLLVTTLGTGVHSFRNDGNGRFHETTVEDGLKSSTGSTSMALGDVDRDGDLDLYVANYGALSVLRSGGRVEVRRVNNQWEVLGPHANRLRYIDGRIEEVGEADVLYLNEGKGRFLAHSWNSPRFLDATGKPKAPPLDYGLGVQMYDVNNDGALDLYVCNDYQTPDRFWLNDGTGNFREAPWQVLRKFPFSSMGVDFADVDRDGTVDFFVVEMASREHARRMRQLSGAVPSPNLPGRPEMRPQVLRNALYRGEGDGTWSEVAEFAGVASTDWSWQPVFLDVDLDGYEDLLVVNGVQFDTLDRDTLARIQRLGRQSPEAARTNLLLYPLFNSPNVALRNRGNLTFEDQSASWGFDSSRISQGIAVADLDQDGDLDVAINCLNDGCLIYRNNSDQERIVVRARGQSPNTHGIGARIRIEDADGVQEQQILSGGRYLSGDDTLRVFAARSEPRRLEVIWPSGHKTILTNIAAQREYFVDERTSQSGENPTPRRAPYFVEVSEKLRHAHHEVLFDDFARQPLLPKQLSSLGPGLAWCDMDEDGSDELIIGTGRGGRIGAFRFPTNSNPVAIRSDWSAPDDLQGFTGWVSDEGRPVVLAAVASYEGPPGPAVIEIGLDRTADRLVIRELKEVPANPDGSPGPLSTADIDGDGDLDLFVGSRVKPGAYPRAAGSRIFRRTDGHLTEDREAQALLREAGMISASAWSDLNADGYPELILATEWGPVRIYRNDRGRLEAWDPIVEGEESSRPTRLSVLTGWWTSITTGDFDGDGRMDIVAGNWGLNTGYSASETRPAGLYFGSIAGTPAVDLIETTVPAERYVEVPRRSLNALSQAFPSLLARYSSHEAFGQSDMQDLLRALPSRPEKVSAVSLASSLFLNRGDRLVHRPLPAAAQFAPAFGLVVHDLDGDGNEDLFVAQNFFAMRVEWPRTDAGRGVWLKGDGTGGFRSLNIRESGIAIRGEQRGAALGDFDHDGRPDLAAAQNGTVTTLWRNTEGPKSRGIRFKGPRGNPTGYGIQVRLRTARGWGSVREIRSGAGYWSQDAAVMFIGSEAGETELQVQWPGDIPRLVRLPEGVNEVTWSNVTSGALTR